MADFPDVGIQNISFRIRSSVSMSQSPFTYDQQVYINQGVRWEGEVTLSPLNRSESKQVEGFLSGLRGMSGTFKIGNPLHTTNAVGTITGSVNDDTVTASLTGAVVGDYFEHNDNLYIITSISGSSVGIMPPLRTSASNSTVDFTLPKGTFRLSTNDIGWSIDQAGTHGFTFAIMEAL